MIILGLINHIKERAIALYQGCKTAQAKTALDAICNEMKEVTLEEIHAFCRAVEISLEDFLEAEYFRKYNTVYCLDNQRKKEGRTFGLPFL